MRNALSTSFSSECCVLKAVSMDRMRYHEHISAPIPVPSFTSSQNGNSCFLPFSHRCNLVGRGNTFSSSVCFLRINFQWGSYIQSTHWPVLAQNTVQPMPWPQDIDDHIFLSHSKNQEAPEESHGLWKSNPIVANAIIFRYQKFHRMYL